MIIDMLKTSIVIAIVSGCVLCALITIGETEPSGPAAGLAYGVSFPDHESDPITLSRADLTLLRSLEGR
jgi:hypothetical protein